MKKLILATFTLALLLPLRAEDFIQNSDFVHGTDGWTGKYDLVQATTPDQKGITLQLKPNSWTTLSQDIDIKAHRMHFTLVYSLSADAQFSTDPKVLDVSGEEAGLKVWQKMDKRPGYASIILEGDTYMHSGMFPFTPKTGTSDQQTLKNPFGFGEADNKQTLTIAFPPGTGTVTIYQATGSGSSSEANPVTGSAPALAAKGVVDQPVNSVPAAPAGDMIENGDFSDGLSHWSGDLHKFADLQDTSNTALPQAPAAGTGGYFELHHGDWLKVTQKVKVTSAWFKISVTYALSSDAEFSKDKDDYTPAMAASHMIGDAGMFVGDWGIFHGDSDRDLHLTTFTPSYPGTSLIRTCSRVLPKFPRSDHDEIGVTFPPGKGTVVIYRISVEPTETPPGVRSLN